jgi:alkylglycerol monooxygenase
MSFNVTDPVAGGGDFGLLDYADYIYNHTEGLFACFYLVKPSRTMCPTIYDTPNFYNLVVRTGPVLFLIENILLYLQGRQLYKVNDSLMGFSALITAAIPQAFIETVLFTFYAWFWSRFRLVDLPYDSWWTFILCILAFDLSLYVAHRGTHEVNLMWAAHQLHHSSEYYNLFAGARNSFIDKFYIGLCGLPWAFILPPGPARAHHQLNLTYQLWIHTSTIGNLGPLEYVLNTPTQHALHHGRNRFCIDMNYAGFLSIWDQLFGTMEWPQNHKDDKIYYGLVHPTRSWDIFYSYFHAFRDIFRRVRKSDNIRDKLCVVVNGPGWEPGKPRLGNLDEIPMIPEDKEPYNKTSQPLVYIYCFIHLVIIFTVTNSLATLHQTAPGYVQLIGFLYSSWTVISVGYILEHKWYAPRFEWARCAMFFVFDWIVGGYVFEGFGLALTLYKYCYMLSIAVLTFSLGYFKDEVKVD